MVNGVIVGDKIGRYDGGRKYRPMETIDFVDQLVNDKWTIRIPRFLTEYHEWWGVWEKARHESMAQKLKPGMTMYEIGAFDGWQGALFAKFVGAENVVLIEPTAEVWPNIRRIWEENSPASPRGCYRGFCASANRGKGPTFGWPRGIDYSTFLKGVIFSGLKTEPGIPSRQIDYLSISFGAPQAMSIDVEGAELEVLQGAVETLRKFHPLLWISAHDEQDETRLRKFLAEFGYRCENLGKDHETHLHFF